MPGAFFDKGVAQRLALLRPALDYLRPRNDGVPTGVNLPTFLVEGPLTWPGQHAGFLGPRHDPWQSRGPERRRLPRDGLPLALGLEVDRLRRPASIARPESTAAETARRCGRHAPLSDQQQPAISVLASGQVGRAFELDREPVAGARPLRPAPLRPVAAAGPAGSWRPASRWSRPTWAACRTGTRTATSSRRSKPLAAAPGSGRGRPPRRPGSRAACSKDAGDDAWRVRPSAEDETSPADPGRDHWARCFFGLFAGAGVRGGQVIGKSDKIGAIPATTPFSPDDVGATVYHVLGLDPQTEVRDRQNRPVQLNRGEVMRSLFTGAAT